MTDNSRPAFASGNPEVGGFPGISERKWYAGKAIEGSVAQLSNDLTEDEAILFAKEAFMIADAMVLVGNH